jgi:hypothetical protein
VVEADFTCECAIFFELGITVARGMVHLIVALPGEVRWSPIIGQAVKLGLRERRTAHHGGQADEIFGGILGKGGAGRAAWRADSGEARHPPDDDR